MVADDVGESHRWQRRYVMFFGRWKRNWQRYSRRRAQRVLPAQGPMPNRSRISSDAQFEGVVDETRYCLI